MKLYVDISDELDPVRFRPASPGELLEAARPHADLEAATDKLVELLTQPGGDYTGIATAVVYTALGGDNE